MPPPLQPARDNLPLIAGLTAGLLTLALAALFVLGLQDALRQQQALHDKIDARYGPLYDSALPAWAFSERQRRVLGLSLADSRRPGRLPALPPMHERNRLALQRPAEYEMPAAGQESCRLCHQFSALSTLPDPLLVLVGMGPAEQAPAPESTAAGAQALAQAPGACRVVEPALPELVQQAAHPGAWLLWHSPERFGCVSCHGGQAGGATLAQSGHRGYVFEERGRLINTAPELWASCGSCHPGDYVPANPLLSRGRQLIRELNCSGCHQTGPSLAAAPAARRADGSLLTSRQGRPGPPLNFVGDKLSFEVLRDWPGTVTEWNPQSRMPQFDLGLDERNNIAAFLAGLRSNSAPADSAATGNTEAGKALVAQARCANCHALPGQDNGPAVLPSEFLRLPGPSLRRIGQKTSAQWIERLLADPQKVYPGTRMPAYELNADQRRDIAAWLVTVSGGMEPPAPAPGAAEATGSASAGRQRFVERGCAGCHLTGDASVIPKLVGPSLVEAGARDSMSLPTEALAMPRLYDYYFNMLKDPLRFTSTPAQMPQFALSDAECAEIAIALLAELPAPKDPDLLAAPVSQATGVPVSSPLDVKKFWPRRIPPQQGGPAWLSLRERSLSPQSCAGCHAQQYEEWRSSRHSRAMGPGVTGQLVDWALSDPKTYLSCLRCHARLSEQQVLTTLRGAVPAPPGGPARPDPVYAANPYFEPGRSADAHGCASCHLRKQTRFAARPGRLKYLWNADSLSAHALQRSELLRESKFCADCHQFEASERTASGGPPLENTFAEWEEWVRRTAKPQSCQDCHMRDGSHRFLGIHDADFVRQSATVSSSHDLQGGQMSASLTLTNSNNGHMLPTYVTPRIWLQGYFKDADGKVICGSWQDLAIGRNARSSPDGKGGTQWHDISDTRIAADESATFNYFGPVAAEAKTFHLEVFCAPDHFYYHAYGRWLRDENRSEAGRQLLAQARAETAPSRSGYYIYRETIKINE